jgi:ATP-dependent Clp protease ATP-binding subunit ClpA
VDAAFEEARMLGHDSQGDEDLLLGTLRANEGVDAAALSSLSVTLEDACEESEGMLFDALSSIGISLDVVRREAGDAFDMGMPDRRKIPYSPRAKNALVGARSEMRRLGDGHLGTEHVLLGILRNADGAAVSMLNRLDVSSEAVEERVFELRRQEAGWRSATVQQEDRRVKRKMFLACGAIAGPLFVLVFLVEGATRTRYDPLRRPVSSLALGDWG